MKIVDYKIVKYTGVPEDIQVAVGRHIRDGWQPLGGCQVVMGQANCYSLQTMVKYLEQVDES